MTMSGVHTSVVGDAHAYTRSKTPWIIERHGAACGALARYLSGGGMSAFGRTVIQEERAERQKRFLAVFLTLAATWLCFLIF